MPSSKWEGRYDLVDEEDLKGMNVDFSTAHANKQTKTGRLYTRCVRSD